MQQEIEQLEYIEEQLVLAELEAGRPVERRSDASPAAILQARVVVAKPKPAPVEKSKVGSAA